MSQTDQKPSDVVAIPGNEVMELSPEAFESFEKQLEEAPSIADNQALQNLLNRPKPWA